MLWRASLPLVRIRTLFELCTKSISCLRRSRSVKATLISRTEFIHPEEDCDGWEPEHNWPQSGEALIEFAGRECYQSWSKPRPESATTSGYIKNSILAHSHFSVIEHATAGFRITGVPRSLTHEFIRHRHFSYSELSQRYVDVSTAALIDHPLLRDIKGESAEDLRVIMKKVSDSTVSSYTALESILKDAGYVGKKVRQAARSVMPEATETRIVVTGNLRAWRHFINLRATVHADDAIRELAIDILRVLIEEFPAVFGDYSIRSLGTGETIAEGQYHELS